MTYERRITPRSMVDVARYPPGASFGPRPMHDVEFVWLLSGSATWRVEHGSGQVEEIVLTPDTAALARPGTIDAYRWDASRHSTHAWVHFEIETGDEGADASGNRGRLWSR